MREETATTKRCQELSNYFQISAPVLWNAYREFEDRLDRHIQEILDDYPPGAGSSSFVPEQAEALTNQSATILRYAMLPRFLGTLE